MFEEMFNSKDDAFFKAIIEFYTRQEGIFCIKDLVKRLDVHRTEVNRMMEFQIKNRLLKPVDKKEVKRILGIKDNRFTYYKIDLSSPFAQWWMDNKRAIALEVLVKEHGKEAKPIITKLKKSIKTKSIIQELKALQLL
ncbi:hypothetical protein COU62_01860 [Candidatus Pacearchaeota archaeon CG10_big_fil_rev_8_21_14_0_10_35_219]|nr:MAG: hypothetical protein COU62_01860 [Candidatus Pacearchaeota archaeon CG10_big_fil_rev_8_21_14_0_10_35_219]